MANKIINYRDLDLNFNRHPLTNDVNQFVELESVKKALRNLLFLKRYEKPFHPEINSGIYDALFESTSPLQLDAIKTMVILLVKKYEPRVSIYDVVLIPNLDGNSFSITLVFSVKNMQTPVNYTFSITRNR